MTGIQPPSYDTPPSQRRTPESKARLLAAIQAAQNEDAPLPRVAHQQHLERLQALQNMSKISAELQVFEAARAKAQYALEDAEEDIHDVCEKNGLSADVIFDTFSPPGTPTRQRVAKANDSAVKTEQEPLFPQTPKTDTQTPTQTPSKVTQTPTQTPSKVTQTPTQTSTKVTQTTTNPVPAIVPGGRVTLASSTTQVKVKVEESVEAQRIPSFADDEDNWYIVYHGRHGIQGLFTQWKGTEQALGPKDICQGYAYRLFRKFGDHEQAQMYWDELNETGVLELLREEPSNKDVFIVIKGVMPGVYTNRLSLLIDGLGWRGGVVMCGEGTRAAADNVYNHWKAAGHVEVLPRLGPRARTEVDA